MYLLLYIDFWQHAFSVYLSLCLNFYSVFQAVQEVSRHYNSLSAIQRKFVAVDTKDIFLRFIYEIGMIFDDDTRTSLLLLAYS